MERCVVSGCNNIGCQSFPKDPELKALWERVIQVKANEHSQICKKHFKDTDYMSAMGISELTGKPQAYRFLRKDVVPSVFPWSSRTDNISSTHSNKTDQQIEADPLKTNNEDHKVPKVKEKHHIEMIRKVVSKGPSPKNVSAPYVKTCKILPKVLLVPRPNIENSKISPKIVSVPQPNIGNNQMSSQIILLPQLLIKNSKNSLKIVTVPQTAIEYTKIAPKIVSAAQPHVENNKISTKIPSVPQPRIENSKISPKIASVPQPRIENSKISPKIASLPQPHIENSKISPNITAVPESHIENSKIPLQNASVLQPHIENGKIALKIASVPQPDIENNIMTPKVTLVEKKSEKIKLAPVKTAVTTSASSVHIENENKRNNDVSYGRCRCCLMEENLRHNDAKINFDMLKNNFNLFLSTDPRLSQLVCSACAVVLNELKVFRETILESERYLNLIISTDSVDNVPAEGSSENDDSLLPVVKTEYDDCVDASLECVENMPEGNDITDASDTSLLKTEIEINLNFAPEAFEDYKCKDDTIVKMEDDLISEHSDLETIEDYTYTDDDIVKTEDEQISGHCDLETIQEILPTPVQSTHKRLSEDDQMESTKKMKNNDSEPNIPTSQIKTKQSGLFIPDYITIDSKLEVASDNTKIRANIILLLKHSTIIPFRNNFNHTFKCFYCDKPCLPFKYLREHTETHTGKLSDMAIFKLMRAKFQKAVYADTSVIKCRLCDERFKDINGIVEHLTKTHKKVYYTTETKLPHGILEFHLDSDTLKCHLCRKEFPVFKRLFTHMNEHIGSYVCRCGKKFIFEPVYNYHKTACLRKNDGKEWKCTHCDEVFKSKDTMRYHREKQHLKTEVKCSFCPETFLGHQYLKRRNHMHEKHGVPKPLCECVKCGKIYANLCSLKDHIRYVHRKKFTCELCGYWTENKSNIKEHMNIHYGIKSHECTFCKKKFGTRYNLRLHIKLHTNDKRFDCTLCDATFIQKHVLKSHMKAKHPDVGIYSIK